MSWPPLPSQTRVPAAGSIFHCEGSLRGLPGGMEMRVHWENFSSGKMSFHAESWAGTAPARRRRLNSRSIEFVQVGGLAELESGERGFDGAQESGEDAAGTDFDAAGDAAGGEQADRGHPAHGIGDLLVEAFAGFTAGADFAGLPVVDEGAGEVGERGGVQVSLEALLGGAHEGAVERRADGEEDGAFGARGLGEADGAVDGSGVPG